MVFHSLAYVLFFLATFIIFWSLSNIRHRLVLLFIANTFFYSWWDYRFTTLIFLSSFVDFWCAKHIRKRPNLIYLSLFFNLGTLFFFKYFNFFSTSFAYAFNQLGISISPITLDLILPLGISYYTFQSMAYTIDVYRKEIEPEESFINFFVFVSFFPQLISGPIERSKHLLPQLKTLNQLKRSDIEDAVILIVVGLFKKLVIADRLYFFYQTALNNPSRLTSPLSHYLTVIFFWVFLYCDFSGYCLIARGCAKLLGIKLVINFKNPFMAKSVSDFFQRWQISLTNWIMDYVFYPLSLSTGRVVLSLLISMTLIGVWHGAALNWLIWGIALFTHLVLQRLIHLFIGKLKAPKFINSLVVIVFMIGFYIIGLITQVRSLKDYIVILKGASKVFSTNIGLQFEWLLKNDLSLFYYELEAPNFQSILAIATIIIIAMISVFQKDRDILEFLKSKSEISKGFIVFFFLLAIFFLKFPKLSDSYYYFQF